MKASISIFLSSLIVLLTLDLLMAQCPTGEEANTRGFRSVSMFYSNPYYEEYRLDLEVVSSQINIDNIEMVSDEAVCNLLESQIMNSGEFLTSVQEQEKAYLKHEGAQRYFIVFYTSPAQPGFSTGVYILDFDLNILGKFGV